MTSILDRILKYYQSIQAVMVLIVVFAVFSFINVPQQKVPKLIINQGVIIGIYPGASSKEVEEQLTSKIENFIIRYNEVDKQKTYSHSKDGIMFIHVELIDELDDEFQFWARMENELAELSLN